MVDQTQELRDEIAAGPSDLDNIFRYIQKLERTTRLLGLLGFTSAVLLGAIIVFTALSVLRYHYPIVLNGSEILLVNSICLGAELAILFTYDRFRRTGDTFYEELSDQLQWDITDANKGWVGNASHRPPLEVRIIFRRYIKNTDLPFTRGAAGILVYAVAAVVFWTLGLLVGLGQ